MHVASGSLIHAPTDLVRFLECGHLVWRGVELAYGRIPDDQVEDPLAGLLAAKGRRHELEWLARYRERGEVAEIPPRSNHAERTALTLEAMRAGAPVIYQAAFAPPGWVAFADFLERVETPSRLGAWSYEVLDTKLAREARPDFAIQISLYSDLVELAQGAPPARMHLGLGDGERRSFRCTDFDSYTRHLAVEYLTFTRALREEVYPEPVDHCAICGWRGHCEARWERDDHLGRVAGIRRDQIRKLVAAGVPTLTALARHDPEARIPRLAPSTFRGLRHQASLQRLEAERGEPVYDLFLPVQAGRGFALLPAPDRGDVFFDMEGDPHAEGGLEYLFGAVSQGSGDWAYQAFWAHDPAEEKRALEAFLDWLAERREAHPAMHVYHYAAYEPTALKRLCGRHGTKEDALDSLLRSGAFVDLYTIVRQSMRVSRPGLSIKQMEAFYSGAREGAVRDAGASILSYELWRETPDDAERAKLLEDIRAYNEDDCRSTLLLREWLLSRAAEAGWTPGAVLEEPKLDETKSDEARRLEEETSAARARLLAGVPAEPAARTTRQRARLLLAHSLDYHRREERPVWWAFFDRQQRDPAELLDDVECLAELSLDADAPPRADKKSTVYTFRFVPQETKLRPGVQVADPESGANAGEVVSVDMDASRVELKRGPSLRELPLPRAIMPRPTYSSAEQRAALRRLAGSLDDERRRAVYGLLSRERPRVRGLTAGAPLHDGVVDEAAAWRVLSALDDSHLFIQGPPGTGKTTIGAGLIVRLLQEGRRVGVTANSHQAIHNLLRRVERIAEERGVRFRGIKKSSSDEGYTSPLARPMVVETKENGSIERGGWDLVAGTSWLFTRGAMESSLDVLVFDEAGQIALPNAAACGIAARNLLFLGDPQQLPQVSLGVHPEGSGVSVLEHLLGRTDTDQPALHDTVAREDGLFLERSFRLHPKVCGYISRIAYEGRLHADEVAGRRRIEGDGLAGTGLRYLPVEHEGNSQRSVEEAARVRAAYDELLGARFSEDGRGERALTHDDILVVAPFNAQVHCLRDALPRGAQVGTVDLFQGQEAPAVIFSMASSSQENVPRGLEFLFSRNRLNVAISRAQCLAILVASPCLLTVRCHTIEQMRLVNALCRFVDEAGHPANPWQRGDIAS